MDLCEPVCYHEAGHAVAAVVLSIGLKEQAIELDSASGPATYLECPLTTPTEDYFEKRAAVKLAGPAAECKKKGDNFDHSMLSSKEHYHQDYNEARRILQKLQTDQGQCSNRVLQEDVVSAMGLAWGVVCQHWAAIELVAKRLQADRYVSGAEVRRIVGSPQKT